MALYKLKSRTNKVALLVTILGVVQTSDLSFLAPETEGWLLMLIGIAMVLLREITDKPIEAYKENEDA